MLVLICFGQVRPNTLEPALVRLKSSGEFSLEGYRSALGIPQLVRPPCSFPVPRYLIAGTWTQADYSVTQMDTFLRQYPWQQGPCLQQHYPPMPYLTRHPGSRPHGSLEGATEKAQSVTRACCKLWTAFLRERGACMIRPPGAGEGAEHLRSAESAVV